MSLYRLRIGGVRRFAVLGLASLAMMFGVQLVLSPAHAASTVRACSGYVVAERCG
jgi:hypothetical protein